MKKIVTFLLFLSYASLLSAQTVQNDSVVVRFTCFDQLHKETIQNVTATLKIGDKIFYKQASQKGVITIKWLKNSQLIGSFNHPLFETTQKNFALTAKQDTVEFTVSLRPIKVVDLKTITVKPLGTPYTVYGSTVLNVADFEIIENGSLVLLAYKKQLKNGSEILLYNGQEVINSFQVPEVAEELIHDFRGNAHIVCKDHIYGLQINENKIGIATLDKAYFYAYIAPIVDSLKTKLFFSNFSKDYPAFNYFSFDQKDSAYAKILHIEDTFMMELYRSEYKWMDARTKLWARQRELETGIDAEVIIGANYFTQSIYYKELYAPLFHKNDTIYVFDYYKDKLFAFDANGNAIDSIPIYHHYQPKSTGWKKNLIQDQKTGTIYAHFELDGYSYIGKINLLTGLIENKVKLAYKYVDKIAVYNNEVYFIYRPFESLQNKYLYKQVML